MTVRGIVFDLGGVVLESPLHFIADFERREGLEPNFIARIVGGYGGIDGPWQRLERGEVSLEAFCDLFDCDIRKAGGSASSRRMMREMAQHSVVRPAMIEAIRRLRAGGIRTAALTNNWVTDQDHEIRMEPLRAEFDLFIESCKVGMRKPETRIYELACEKLALSADQIAFLDDIGGNLKVARQLGMRTIKVGDPRDALSELESIVGFRLTE